MLKLSSLLLLAAVTFMLPSISEAKEGCSGDCTSCHKLTVPEASDLLKKVGVVVKSVKPSPANGFFEILVEKEGKPGLLLMDYSKKHVVQGVMVKLPEFQSVASHQQELADAQKPPKVDVSKIPASNAVVMGNPKGSKKLFVFTDPDCPYCRQFHTELKKLEKIAPDVAIHVMLFPLPMHPAAFDKARVVVEKNSLELLDKAFEGKELPKPGKDSSKDAINEIIKFGNANGINGTPTLVLPDGSIMVGGRDAESLKKMLEGK
ncbi:DsbC family protein [Pelotalea chapellei]|uniref:DsbC family protein n=1 Tax=Pelotalea chapellei TaxID=44671 RepID=A0ABS5U467_9BACT|nr:DsbC family protein [Pelotalea chapellei]MBT1070459.1 DsbC family protein [Pelotalea chapellei]